MTITVHDDTTGAVSSFTDDVMGAFAQAAYLLGLRHAVRLTTTEE